MELIELLSIDIDVEPIVELGDSGTGTRRLIPFAGGTFSGRDGLRGTVTPGGADWQYVRREYYFRTHIRLSTADESLQWMNELIAVSAGERRRSSVRINVFQVT